MIGFNMFKNCCNIVMEIKLKLWAIMYNYVYRVGTSLAIA